METILTKELPFGEPSVRCFLFEAYPLSILSVKEDYKQWFYSNYIQLCCYENFIERNEVFLQFHGPDQGFNSPYLKKQYLSWETFPKDKVDIVDFVIANITSDYYFYCYVDEYDIPHRKPYHTYHLMHDLFIYGFDNENNVFMILGYDENKQFKKNKVSYDDFRTAFLHNDADKKKQYWTDRIYMFKFDDTANYNFDVQCIIDLTEDYLQSRNTGERDRRFHNPYDMTIFGIKTYDCLITYYKMLLEHRLSFDVRIPYLLWEHKKCMRERLDFMIHEKDYDNLNGCFEEYIKLEEIAKTILNLMMKYNQRENPSYINKIIGYLQQLKKGEVTTLEDVLVKLK